MIDLHCHLIPGVDDGPNTLEESLRLCRIAVADGISHAICTPHIHPGRWENTRHSIAQQCDHLQQQLNQQGIPLHLGFAGEVRLTDRIMDQVENDEIPFYGAVDGYSVMLLEFPHGHVIPGSEKLVAWLLDRNIRPLIAHPERNRQLMKDPAQIGPFVTAGCWLQITAGSLLGNFGARAQKTADLLLRNDMVAVLASDGHNAAARQPVLKRAFSLVVDRLGIDKAKQLMLQTPGIIAGGQFGERDCDRMNQFIAGLLRHKRNIIAVLLGQIIAALGTLIGVRLLTQYVSPALFGEYKLLLAGISLVSGVCIRPFIQFTMREYHDAVAESRVYRFLKSTRRFFRVYLLSLAAIIAIPIAFYLEGRESGSMSVLYLMLIVLVVASNVELNRALMTTRNAQMSATAVSIARNWFVPPAIVLGVLVFEQGTTVILMATILVLASLWLAQELLTSDTSSPAESDVDFLGFAEHFRGALGFAMPLALVGVLSWLVHESDRFFLSYYHSERVVGIYSAAYGLVSAPFTLLIGSMAQLLYPLVFRASSDGDSEHRNNLLRGMLIVSSVICGVGLLVVGLFDSQIAWLALGAAYREEASGLLFWIAFGYGLHAVAMSFDLAAYGGKKTVDIFLSYGVAALANVIFNIVLIPKYSAMGAVIATFISLLLYLATMAALFFIREQRREKPVDQSRIQQLCG